MDAHSPDGHWPDTPGSSRVTADQWRRVGAVLDRLSDTDLALHPESIDEACRTAGVSRDLVEPFIAAARHAIQWSERLDPVLLHEALSAHAHGGPTAAPPLESGTRLGVYEIVAAIGRGGMGDVYKARDTRLDRSVALKVLRPQIAEHAAAQQRFEREAKALSSLNHPHICTLYDVGRDPLVPCGFLVMELVEGETLAARIERAPLSGAQALEYAAQIADTLAAAHRHGIVHRDLKPANVMLTLHGVKLLDFGLATLRPASGSVRGFEDALTAEGTLLGTLPYMSPEQIQGKPVDERTDIFALGAILYEMLTRRKAFDADNPASVIATVLERDPPPVTPELQDLPAAIDRVLGRCLAKSPDARWQSAADLASELRWLRDAPASPIRVSAPRSRLRGSAAALAAIVVVIGAAGIGTYWFAEGKPASVPLFRFPIPPADGTRYVGLFAISPDGRRLVFTAVDAAGVNALWLRPFDALASERLAGTQGASYPFWSPDGRSVGFFADRKLKILDVASGVVRVLCDAGRGGGGTWNTDDEIVFAPESAVLSAFGLMRVAASGGSPVPITTLSKSAPGLHSWPRFLPDGRHYLYSRIELTNGPTRGIEAMAVYVGTLDGPESKKVVQARRAVYANGNLFWVDQGRLMAQRFDVTRLQLTGEPLDIAQDIEQTAPGRAAFDVSPSGVIAYRTGRPRANQLAQLTWFDRAAREVGRIGEPAAYSTAVVSPDARYALAVRGGNVLRIDVGNGTATPLPERDATSPVWNPDGTRVAFTGGVAGRGPTSVSVRAVDGSGASEVVLPLLAQVYPSDWSSDGQFIVGSVIRADTGYDLFTTRLGSHTATYPVASASDETDAHLSPDMHWIAYAATDESRRWDVYVRPFGEGGGVWRVSRSGGRHPRWRKDGRELFYVTPEGDLVSASFSAGSSFRITDSRTLFRQPTLALDFNNPLSSSRYDVSRDGQRFLVRMPAESSLPEPIVVLLNWTSPVQH